MVTTRITKRNSTSAPFLEVLDENGTALARLMLGYYGTSSIKDYDRLVAWLDRAIQQYAVVNDDDPFPPAEGKR